MLVCLHLFTEDIFIEDETTELDLRANPGGFNHTLHLEGGLPDMVWGVVIPVIDLVEPVADILREMFTGLAMALEFCLDLPEELTLGEVARNDDGIRDSGTSLLDAETAPDSDAFVRRLTVDVEHLL